MSAVTGLTHMIHLGCLAPPPVSCSQHASELWTYSRRPSRRLRASTPSHCMSEQSSF